MHGASTPSASQQPVITQPDPARGTEYAALLRQVRPAGLLERRHTYSASKITITRLLLASGWSRFVLLCNSWAHLAGGVFL